MNGIGSMLLAVQDGSVDQPGFGRVLFDFLFSGAGEIPASWNGPDLLVFALAAACVGIASVILNWLVLAQTGRSPLGLGYAGLGNSMIALALWGAGAIVGAFLGAWADIFELTRNACLTAGVGWPAILPKLLETRDVQETAEDEQQPRGES